MFQVLKDDCEYEYQCNLSGGPGDKDGPFQWKFMLSRIIELPANDNDMKRIFVVVNRGWRHVGPEFLTRKTGSQYLGYNEKNDKVVENRDRLIAEYDAQFSDAVETHRQSSQEKKRFGRPSEGRSERLQFSTTPVIADWIASQSKKDESFSQTLHRLLEEMKEGK